MRGHFFGVADQSPQWRAAASRHTARAHSSGIVRLLLVGAVATAASRSLTSAANFAVTRRSQPQNLHLGKPPRAAVCTFETDRHRPFGRLHTMDRAHLGRINLFSSGYLCGGDETKERAIVLAMGTFQPGLEQSKDGERKVAGEAPATKPSAKAKGAPQSAPKNVGEQQQKASGNAAKSSVSPGGSEQPKAMGSLPRTGVHTAGLQFVDIGANLLDPMFQGEYRGKHKHEPDLDAVLERAYAAGVNWMMVTAGNLQESKDAVAMCKARKGGLACTVGVHPTRCSEFDAAAEGPEAYLRGLQGIAKEALDEASVAGIPAPVVAIGEFGLDYDRLEFCPKEVQLKYFELQLRELAKPLGLPLFLHCRTSEAAQDLYELLRKNADCLPPKGQCPGVVHSFDGELKDAMLFIELGFAIGINGCSLKTAENLEVVRQLPVESIMLETDAPWCNIRPTHAGASFVRSAWEEVKKPEKWEAGKCVKDRTEPCHMAQVLEVVAGARGVPQEQLGSFASGFYDRSLQVFFPGRR